jgi:hypothetical protein
MGSPAAVEVVRGHLKSPAEQMSASGRSRKTATRAWPL